MRFLVQFRLGPENLDKCRFEEFDALLELHQIAPRRAYRRRTVDSMHSHTAFIPVDFPCETTATSVCSRMVFVKNYYCIHAESESGLEGMTEKLASLITDLREEFSSEGMSWSVEVEAHMRKAKPTKNEKTKIRTAVCDFLRLKGPVKLKAPRHKFVVLELEPHPDMLAAKSSEAAAADIDTASPVSSELKGTRNRWYLLRFIGTGCKQILATMNMKQRVYRGPTSLDPELSMVMANQVLARPGAVVLDPYCGSGSLLLACAALKAHVVGADIDYCILAGVGRGRKAKNSNNNTMNVMTNFDRYGYARPEVVCLDMARQSDCLCLRRRPQRPHQQQQQQQQQQKQEQGEQQQQRSNQEDSASMGVGEGYEGRGGDKGGEADRGIVTDPPYGLRAGARTLGRATRKGAPKPIPAQFLATHVKPTQKYSSDAVLDDLLCFASHALRAGGRLVYLAHQREEEQLALMARHSRLRLLTRQRIPGMTIRTLVVMEKEKEKENESGPARLVA